MGSREQFLSFPGAVITPESATPIEAPANQAQPENLAAFLQENAPKKEEPVQPVQETAPKGDELIEQANAVDQLTEEESTFARLLNQSVEIVQQQAQEDPEFASIYEKETKDLDAEGIANWVIDRADDFKIKKLKETDPTFTQQNAYVTSLADEASFGQLSRLAGTAESLISGTTDSEDVKAAIEAKAEKYRLLEKEYGATGLAGRVSSYFIPFSPAAKLFKAASGAAKVAKGGKAATILGKMIENPNILQKAAVGAVSTGAGVGALGAVRGGLGQDLQTPSLERSLDQGVEGLGFGILLGGGLPLAGKAIEVGARPVQKALQPAVKSSVKAIEGVYDRLVSELSNVQTGTLKRLARESIAGKPKIGPSGEKLTVKAQANNQSNIADDLTDFLQSSRSKLPEVEAAEKILPKLPAVDMNLFFKFTDRLTKLENPSNASQVEKLKSWIEHFKTKLSDYDLSKVPADKVQRLVIDDIQRTVQYGTIDDAFLNSALKTAGRVARLSIRKSASQANTAEAELYSSLMDKAADKRSILAFISNQLGKTPENMAKRAEGYISNLFGKNKTFQIDKMRQLDKRFGTDFAERAQLASMAKELGPTGTPRFISQSPTGRSVLGLFAGGAIGGAAGLVSEDAKSAPLGAVTGLLLTSPILGARLIGGSTRISGFTRQLFANPEALERLANSGSSTSITRRIFKEIFNTYQKDGPASASGIVRIVADTPYFIGIVNEFDKAEREQASKNKQNTLNKLSQ